jgi:acyl carrier protein
VIRKRHEFVDSEFEQPVGWIEASIAEIEAQVLGIERFGRSDSFFDFDGTSMDAIQVCARIESEVGFQVPPHWLFENDVLSDLVSRIQAEAEPVRPDVSRGE